MKIEELLDELKWDTHYPYHREIAAEILFLFSALTKQVEELKCCGNCGNLECCEGIYYCCLNNENYSPASICKDHIIAKITREERSL